jgi:hypothetical protein
VILELQVPSPFELGELGAHFRPSERVKLSMRIEAIVSEIEQERVLIGSPRPRVKVTGNVFRVPLLARVSSPAREGQSDRLEVPPMRRHPLGQNYILHNRETVVLLWNRTQGASHGSDLRSNGKFSAFF